MAQQLHLYIRIWLSVDNKYHDTTSKKLHDKLATAACFKAVWHFFAW